MSRGFGAVGCRIGARVYNQERDRLTYTVWRAIVASQRVSTSQACRPYLAAAGAPVVAHVARFRHLDVGDVRDGVAAMAPHFAIDLV